MEPSQQQQTRVPVFLWEALKDTFNEHDQQFLRDIAPLVGVSVADLRKTIFGMRNPLTTVAINTQPAWWEGTHCPVRMKTPQGIWKLCGEFCEAHGFCCKHRGFRLSNTSQPTARLASDPFFTRIAKRVPYKWEGEVVWVGEDGSVLDTNNCVIEGLNICYETGILLEAP
jgi:hypothetical protein